VRLLSCDSCVSWFGFFLSVFSVHSVVRLEKTKPRNTRITRKEKSLQFQIRRNPPDLPNPRSKKV
jgi:hypothetical protein